ncbi:MAG: DUF6468 domain-containing protein [Bdellovibrionales bacterium]
MTAEWIGLILDCALIAVVGAGVVQATRLVIQLRDLRASRAEMERFVREFNSAVVRAEAGIKTLRTTARESGDDLEKLVEKAVMVRDELNFIVESADGVADRLSVSASKVMHENTARASGKGEDSASVEQRGNPKPTIISSTASSRGEKAAMSRAEQELMQALKKLG